MIIRFYRAIVHDGQQAAYQAFLFGTLPLMFRSDGLSTVSVGLPHSSSPNEFSLLEFWRDMDAVKAFAGEDWQKPVIYPGEAEMLREVHVHHYHLADGPS